MATLQNMIELYDGVSPTLNRITNCAETVANRFAQAGTAAGAMGRTVDAAVGRFAPELNAAVGATNAVAAGMRAVRAAAGGAAEIDRIHVSAAAAAGSVNELGAACNQIRAPASAADSVEAVGLAATRAASSARRGFSGFTEQAVQAARKIIELGVACDRVNIPGDLAQGLSEMGDAAVVTAAQVGDISNAASQVEQSVRAVREEVERLIDAFDDSSRLSEEELRRRRMRRRRSGGFREILGSTFGQFTMASLAANAITGVVRVLSEVPAALIRASDEYSGIMARINLVTSSQREAAALNDQIYYSALRARGGYAEMADAVSKIAMTAKEAFPDPQQVVPFMENIQKLFAIGGTDKIRQQDALLQLTQALGSGRLQGDEFRSIAEAAPMIEQVVARYMRKTQGELKQLSSDGQITAEIIKNAILGATMEIDAKFDTIPMKWEDVTKYIKTQGFRAFVPAFEQLSRLADSITPVKQTAEAAAIGLVLAGQAVSGLINNLWWLAGVAKETGIYIGAWIGAGFSVLAPLFRALIALAMGLFIVYAAGWGATLIPLAASVALKALNAAWDAILIAYGWLQYAALAAQNAQLLLLYIRMGIVAAASAAWALVTQGVTAALRALNLTILMNPIGIVITLVMIVIAAFTAWGIASHGLRNTIADVFDALVDICQAGVNAMIIAINQVVGVINKAAEGMNALFGTKISMVGTLEAVDFQKAKKWSGYFREGTLMKHIGDIMPQITPPPRPTLPPVPGMPSLEEVGKNTKDTADNTKAIKDAMELDDEDLNFLRDMAEQEAINRFTTAEIKFDMTNHNTINNDLDIDGVITTIGARLAENMQSAAEGVHV